MFVGTKLRVIRLNTCASFFPVHAILSLVLIKVSFLLSVKAVILIFISRRGSAISSAKQGKSGSIYNLVNKCLGRANVRAFHENPNRIHTELTLLTLKAHNHKMYVLSSTKIFEAS